MRTSTDIFDDSINNLVDITSTLLSASPHSQLDHTDDFHLPLPRAYSIHLLVLLLLLLSAALLFVSLIYILHCTARITRTHDSDSACVTGSTITAIDRNTLCEDKLLTIEINKCILWRWGEHGSLAAHGKWTAALFAWMINDNFLSSFRFVYLLDANCWFRSLVISHFSSAAAVFLYHPFLCSIPFLVISRFSFLCIFHEVQFKSSRLHGRASERRKKKRPGERNLLNSHSAVKALENLFRDENCPQKLFSLLPQHSMSSGPFFMLSPSVSLFSFLVRAPNWLLLLLSSVQQRRWRRRRNCWPMRMEDRNNC